jgi:tetratricopeptide (TPR) repeat protein
LKRRLLLLLALSAATAPAAADVLVLRGGSRLSFPSCERAGDRVVCQTGAGSVSFDAASVLQLLQGEDEKGAAPTWRAPESEEGREEPDPVDLTPTGALEWTLQGFAHEQQGRWEEARAAYGRAAGSRRAPMAARLGLARVMLRQGEAREAAEVLDAALLDEPDNAKAHFLLGEALDAQDRLDEAVREWQRAAALDPAFADRRDRGLRELRAHRDFHRAFAPHFTVSYDGERDEELGRAILEALEDAFDELVGRLEHYPENTIQVILYSRQAFDEVTGAGPDIGGLFDGKVRLPVGGLRRVTPPVRAVARHELTHAFLHSKGEGRVPRWIHEGLAQQIEERPAGGLHRSLARSMKTAEDPLVWAAEFSYPRAYSRVLYLEDRYGPGALLDLVDALGEGESAATATRRVFGATPEEILGEWVEWLEEQLP